MTRRLKAVVDMSKETRHLLSTVEVVNRTAKLAESRGAAGLEVDVVTADGDVWNGVLPAELRCRATAVFPDGHTVVGDSDPYNGALMIYETESARWIQACDRLTAQFETGQ